MERSIFASGLPALIIVAQALCAFAKEPVTRTPVTREVALAQVDQCIHAQPVDSENACRNLKTSLAILVDVYERGDRSVLPALANFPYLYRFFDDALLADPQGFLSALNTLPADKQEAVAHGLAGDQYFNLSIPRFEAIRSALEAVPADSPNKALAARFLETLKVHNASDFLDYFPRDTFRSQFIVDINARALYSLGEMPLFGSKPSPQPTWRFTLIGGWGSAESVTLSINESGGGTICLKRHKVIERGAIHTTDQIAVSVNQVRQFLDAIKDADFWNAQALPPPSAKKEIVQDGASYLLEGLDNGRYHVVDRTCPNLKFNDRQTLAIGRACRLLLQFAGRPYAGDC